MAEIIIDRATLRVEYFRAQLDQSPLVYIFTPSLNRSLEGNKFGGEFILRSGFSVVAVKSSVDDWFQCIGPSDLERMASFACEKGHEQIMAYGSSMGGYGALCFVSELGIKRACLISPQFSIREDFDRRWATLAESINWWREPYARRDVNDLEITVLFDPFDADKLHAKRIQAEFPGVNLVALPFSGHPATFFLNDAGLLKESILELLSVGALDVKKIKRHRLSSKTYLRNLSKRLSDTDHHEAAITVLNRLVSMNDLGHDDYLMAAAAFVSRALPYRALEVLNRALEKGCKSAQIYYSRSHVLAGFGYLRESLNDISWAFVYDSNSPDILAWRGNILIQLRQYADAVVSLKAAIRINAASPIYFELLAQALESLGEPLLAAQERERGRAIGT